MNQKYTLIIWYRQNHDLYYEFVTNRTSFKLPAITYIILLILRCNDLISQMTHRSLIQQHSSNQWRKKKVGDLRYTFKIHQVFGHVARPKPNAITLIFAFIFSIMIWIDVTYVFLMNAIPSVFTLLLFVDLNNKKPYKDSNAFMRAGHVYWTLLIIKGKGLSLDSIMLSNRLQ